MTDMTDLPAEPITDPDHEDAPGADAADAPAETDEDNPETFPREYVEELRKVTSL